MADNRSTLPNDSLLSNLDDFSSHLGTANNGFNDFVSNLGGLVNSVRRIDTSLGKNTTGLLSGLSEVSSSTRGLRPVAQVGRQSSYDASRPRIPDIGDMFQSGFQHPGFNSNMSRNISNAVGSGINRGFGNLEVPSAISRAKDTLNPASFVQDAMMFGAVFPAQLKMAETIVQPITGMNEAFAPIKSFSKGFTGLDSAVEGFKSQLTSPIDMYEGIYQSQAMLGSALGGAKAADQAMTSALKMARDYPVKTEDALGALTKLAVYPEVKPHLKSEKFQTQLMETVSGLSLIAPEQGMKGAMFSLVEAMSGSWRSMQMRFNVSPEVIQSLSGMTKSEMSSDPTKLVEGLHRFVGKAVGLDVLEKQKYTFSKQIDNFGDSVQMVTKNVMESTGLYKTITGAATAFQTGFSSLGNNKEFLNYATSIFKPYQTRTDKAVSSFMGVGVGAYKSMPMSQVMEAMEKNFEGLSMDEIGQRFENLIDDMGGIQKDTTLKIDGVLSGKFGDVLGLIGGDIAAVATKTFSNMASGVISGIGGAIMESPMSAIGSMVNVALPALITMGGLGLIPKMLGAGFKSGTFGQIGRKASGAMQGTPSLGVSSMRMSTGGSPSAISDVAMGGGIGGRSTRSSIGNLLNAQRVRLDDIITSDIKRTTNQLDSISGGISARRGAVGSTTKMNVINSAIDRSLDTSTMSRGNKKAFSDYFDRLKKSGFSDSDIGKLTNTLRMESIESLENKTYVDRGTRSARRSDMSTLRRELSGVSYNYDMSRSTERAIRYTGAKSSYGDAFKIGDEVTSQMASKLKDAAKDYTNIANVRSTSALSSITDSNALSRFASDLNVSVADISSGNISNEQLQLLRQNGKWLRESSENARGLLDGFRSNRFQGVTAIEQRTRQILPNVDRIMSAASARDNVSRLGSYDFSTLSSPKTADKMVRLLNRNREALSSISVDVPANLRSSLGGAKQLNLMEAINTPQFQSYRRGGLGTLATMSPANQQRALAGNTALSALENDPNLFKQVIGQMDTGGTRLGALKNINKLSTLIRRSSTMRNIGRLGGGLMSFIDPLFIGMQSHSIAKEMGLSGSQAMGAGVGAAGALGGGLLGARRLMGAGAFTKSLGKVGGLGGGLAVLTTGLDLINSKLKSDRAIDEQRQSYMADMGSINFEGVDRTALTKAGGSVINNEKLRKQQAKKSMMDNALLKTLLIGGGATAAVMSGGTLIPMLGLAAAGMGASQTGSDYFSGKSKMTTEAKGLQGLTSGFMGGSEFYNKKIQDLNSDISELEYKNIAGGGLTGAEQTKLMTTRKLKSDSETNKAIQLKAINTVADIYGTTDKGYSESRDDERSSASYKLVNYLQKDRQSTDKVSEYLGAAATSSQVSQDLNTVMQEGVEEKNSMKVRRSVINSAKINNEMSARFVDTLKDVDFSDNNQVQTVLQAEMGRLNSLVAPLGDKKGMDLYKELNTASLIQSKMFNQVRSTLAPSKNERNLYSTLEMETGRKLAQIGVTDPYEALGMSKEDYFKQQGVELPGKGTSGVAESTLSKLKGLGISDVGSLTDEISSSQLFGFGTSKTKMDTVKDSGKFNEDEIQELEKSKASAKKVKTTGEDYNTIQVNAFKGFISAISDNEQSFKTVDKQQDKYEAANLSGFSKGKRLELEYAMNRRGSSISDIKGEGLTEIAQQKFGKDVSLENLSNTQITELMQDEGVKNLDVFGKMKTGADEFEKSSLALGRVFETTSQTVEKRFALSLEKAGVAVNTFSDGITSSGDFSTKTMGFINSINDSIETMSVSGKSKKYAAEQGFQDMRKDGIADLGFKLAGVDSAADLSKVDERGLTGIDRLRKMGTLSDDQFGQVSQLRSEYESGEKDILKSKSMGMQAAGKIGQFAFQASSVGSQEFQNVTSSMLGTNQKQRQRLRESSAKELQTAFQGYEGASTPEEKKKWSTFIDSNIASQRKLGLNDYQIRAGVSQYAGGDMGAYDRVAGSRVDALVSKTNSDVMLSLLGGADVKTTKETEGLSSTEKMEYAKLQSPDERKKYLTDSKGYGSISKGEDTLTFNKDHSKLMGESVIDAASQINQGATFPVVENMTNAISQTMDTQQFDSAVNNFRQASTAQIDTISKQSEMANTTITTAAIDSDVNKTVAQQQPITIDTQQTDIGDRTIETTAAASNAAALEGLINKAPSIAPPINDESFMLAP